MKKQESEVRKTMIVVRMNQGEVERVEALRRQSTEKNLSTYLRKVGVQQPVTLKYRNESADDFLRDMLLLRKELSELSNVFHQAVHQLQLLQKIPEFREWIRENEGLQNALVVKVEEINSRIAQLYEQWLLK